MEKEPTVATVGAGYAWRTARRALTLLSLASLAAGCAIASGELTTFTDAGAGGADVAIVDARPYPADAPQETVVDGAPGVPDATIVDARPERPDAPVDAGCTSTVVNLLANPSFDLGPTGWVESSSLGWPIIMATTDSPDFYPIIPESGSYGVWMGGDDSEFATLYQDVVIPDGATALEVTGYQQISTDELWGNGDVSSVQIRDTDGMLVEELHQWSNSDSTASWRYFSYAPVGAYAGQTIRLSFQAVLDDSYVTSFYYDTIELNATVCM